MIRHLQQHIFPIVFFLYSPFIHLCFLYFACALIKQKTRPKYQRYTDGYRCCSRCQTKKKECKEEKKNEANNECTLRCTYFVKHETSYFSDHTFSQVVNGVDDNCEKGKINNDNILKHLRHRFSCFSTNSIVSSNFVFSEVDHVWVAQLDRSQLSCAWILCKQQTRKISLFSFACEFLRPIVYFLCGHQKRESNYAQVSVSYSLWPFCSSVTYFIFVDA